jgi:HK97 family phage major capsid protein
MSTALLARAVEKQNKIWQRMQEITAVPESENRDMTDEERANWDAAEADLTEASRDIERLERMANLDKVDRSQIITATRDGEDRGGNGEDTERQYREAFGTYLRRGLGRLTQDQQQLMEGRYSEVRAQGTVDDTAGGYLVPDEFRNTMTETMKAFGGLLGLAEVITTTTGADLQWPTNDDTGNEGALLAEGATVTEQDVTLGSRKLKAHTYTSKMVKVNLQLLQDTAFALESWLPQKLGERIGRAAAGHLATGTGIDQPEGITTNTTVGKTGAAGQTTSVIYDDLIDLEHSVDPAYRGNGQYVFHDSTLKVLRKLKDGDSRPLWVPVPAPGFPATINGFRYTIDNKMPEPGASKKTIVFGDIRAGYIVRQVLQVQTLRLSERYADSLQVAFLGFARLDGMVNDTSAIKLYAHPAS